MFAISCKLTQSLFWSSDKVKVLGARFCIFKLSDYQLRGGHNPQWGRHNKYLVRLEATSQADTETFLADIYLLPF